MTVWNIVLIVLFMLVLCGGAGFLLWLVFGRDKKGRSEDRAAGGFLDKLSFLRGGSYPFNNRFGK